MKKKKNNTAEPGVKGDPAGEVPAYDLFCNELMHGERYEWQSWGLVLRHLRDFAGMDQAVFGRLLRGYTRAQISRYETERSEPPVDFWVKIAKTFGLNITWALTGKGQPHTTDFCEGEEMAKFYKWIILINEKADFLKELQGDEHS